MRKFLSKGHIKLVPSREVKNITDFFTVPKGTNDICMVFNGTKSGLTDVLWATSFWLLNASSMLRTVSFNHCLVNIDLGEYFINLPLDLDLGPYSAECLELLKGGESEERILGWWERT